MGFLFVYVIVVTLTIKVNHTIPALALVKSDTTLFNLNTLGVALLILHFHFRTWASTGEGAK